MQLTSGKEVSKKEDTATAPPSNWILYAIFATIALAGLVLLHFGAGNKYSEAVASTLLTSGLLGALFQGLVTQHERKLVEKSLDSHRSDTFSRLDEHHQKAMKMLKLHDAMRLSGLLDFYERSSEYSFTDMILNSSELTIVCRDGLSWFKTYAVDIRNRFGKSTKTTVYIIDRTSGCVETISKHCGQTPDSYRSKLETSEQEFLRAYDESAKKGTLEVRGMVNPPAQAMYLSDGKLVTTPYQTGSKRLAVPLFVFDATSLQQCGVYRFTSEDLGNLRSETTLRFRCTPDPGHPDGYNKGLN